jgi:uncharacterized repeat protein (TIGR01451 family)
MTKQNKPTRLSTLFFRLALTLSFSLFSYYLHAQTEAQWAKGINGKGRYSVKKSQHDSKGNLVLFGTYNPQYLRTTKYDTMDFDPGPETFTNYDFPDYPEGGSFVLKLDSSGNFLWAVNFGEKNSYAMALDANDNIYLSFRIFQTFDADPGEGEHLLEGSWRFGVLVVLDKAGKFVRATKTSENRAEVYVDDIDFDENNDLILGGAYHASSGEIELSDSTLTVNAKSYQMFVMGMSKYFDFNWIVAPSGNYSGGVNQVRYHNRTVVFSGFFSSSITWKLVDTILNIPNVTGQPDLFYASYSVDSGLLWVKNIDNEPKNGGIACGDIRTTSDSNLLFLINSPNKLDLSYNKGGYDEPAGDYQTNTVLIKTKPDGTILWAKYVLASSMDVSNDFIYLYGLHRENLDVDPGFGLYHQPIYNKRGDMMLSKSDQDGNFIWARSYSSRGSNHFPHPFSLSVDKSNDITVVGNIIPFYGDLRIKELPDTLEAPTQSYYDGISIIKFKQSPCSDIGIHVEKLRDLSCKQSAIITAARSGNGGTGVWSFDTDSLLNDSTAYISTTGTHEIRLTRNECEIRKNIYVDGPELDSSIAVKTTQVASRVVRPGFKFSIQTTLNNLACEDLDGLVSINVNELANIISAWPTPVSLTKHKATFDFSNMSFSNNSVGIELKLEIDTSADIGDTVVTTTEIEGWNRFNDSVTRTKILKIPIVNSFDPNQLKVSPRIYCEPKYILKDETIEFLVEFQNEGNADAIDVKLVNFVDPNLDLSSFSLVQKSHDISSIQISKEDYIIITYDSILLPPKSTSEIKSIGFVRFAFNKAMTPLKARSFGNITKIYFDYNKAIATNHLETKIVSQIPKFEVSVVAADGILSASMTGTSYQWFHCKPNPTIIAGADSFSFTPDESGDYAVVIKDGNCVDTSDCYSFFKIGLEELAHKSTKLFPNPSSGLFHLNMDIKDKVEVVVMDLNGRRISNTRLRGQDLDLRFLEDGIYIVRIWHNNKWSTHKAVIVD